MPSRNRVGPASLDTSPETETLLVREDSLLGSEGAELEDGWNQSLDGMSERQKLLEDERGLRERGQAVNTGRPRRDAITYEDALLACGWGKFHLLVLLLCGWAVSSDAIEILSVSFLLPSATCDLQITSEDKGWLNSIVFVGMMVGGYLWGSLADKWGRRNILIWSLLVNAVGNLASSVSQVFWLFLVCRFISGIGVGGSMPVIFTYYTEFQHKSKRGAMISLLATFWMSGNIVAAVLAWLVIPREYLSFVSSDFTFHSWRVFVAMCTAPSLTSAAMFVLMPESPKFLLQTGREEDAKAVLTKVHLSNKSGVPLKMTRLVLTDEEVDVYEEEEEEFHNTPQTSHSCCDQVNHTGSKLLASTVHLFKGRLLRITSVLLVINFTLSFGYYGLFMWFPELFSRIEKYGGTICDLGTPNNTNTTDDPCSSSPGNEVYLEGFLTAVSNLPGNILTIFLVDRVGRKPFLVSSMILSGVTVFFLWFVRTRWQNVMMSCLFGAISVCGFNMLDVLQTELFPTEVRSTAFGLQTCSTRLGAILGNIIFGQLVDFHCAVPMLLVACLLVFGGLTSIALPNTTGVDIH